MLVNVARSLQSLWEFEGLSSWGIDVGGEITSLLEFQW